MSSRVVVIGAGLAGLSAACHLAGAGYHVTVVERETIPGGRSGRIVRDGFTFDTGPTVMTMPGLIVLRRAPRLPQRTDSAITRNELARSRRTS
jgi:phytoene dehydrogenase-like protein